MKDFLKEAARIAIVIYIVNSIGIICLGAFLNSRDEAPFCKLEWSNIEYLMPAFRIGCWLGE